MTKESKQFEKDVWAFVKKLDKSAEVLFDCKIPDKDTGSPRQVDAWINAKIGKHFPISILVSCKSHKRKLNITHIESFAAEVRSTGASTGVIYSSSDFTRPALKKATSYGLSCCRLFRYEPAEIPQQLIVWVYCCIPIPRMKVKPLQALKKKGITSWNDFLKIKVNKNQTLSDCIIERLCQDEENSFKQFSKDKPFPTDWTIEGNFCSYNDPSLKFNIIVQGIWKLFRGRIEAHLLRGSYCFQNKSFRGGMFSPIIDMINFPGPDWEEIDKKSIYPIPKNISIISITPNFEQMLLNTVKNKKFLFK